MCTILDDGPSTHAAVDPDTAGFSVGGAGSSTHSVKINNVPAAAMTLLNAAVAAGNIIQIVMRDAGGVIVGVFAAENVSGTAVSPTGFSLSGDGATNSCDVGSTGVDGDGSWATVEVKIIQA